MGDTIFDMSVGYDLEGIKSERVLAFINGMKNAETSVERLRREIPDEFRAFRDLDFKKNISDTLTLSTFHGCPPEEIEKIIDYLLKEHGLSCVIKLNPTLLGPSELRRLMKEEMGYAHIDTPDSAFEKDTRWEQAEGFVERLAKTAEGLGLGFGVKFNNTLIVENKGDGFLPASEKEMYLSGPPLHVVAVNLVNRFRARFGDSVPISFSAGIDKLNFPDAVGLGLVPITVCSDLLKPGGYARAQGYFQELDKRMDAAGAATIKEFVLKGRANAQAALDKAGLTHAPAAGSEDYARWVSAAVLLNTEDYCGAVTSDPRYGAQRNAKPPRKVGTKLSLFDCITCDKCVPVCPNDANFSYDLPKEEVPILKLFRKEGKWLRKIDGNLTIAKKHQLANFVDFCNECGNCDIFCPEDGGPYAMKPRFFGSLELFKEMTDREGFHVAAASGRVAVHGRFKNKEFHLVIAGEEVRYAGPDFRVSFKLADPPGTIEGDCEGEVDLTYFFIMARLQQVVLAQDQVNYVNS
jgi:putative selenate reductase